MRARCSHNVLRLGKYFPNSIVRRIASSVQRHPTRAQLRPKLVLLDCTGDALSA